MLQAMTESGRLITPANWTWKEIQEIRKMKAFFCPGCRNKVIFRAGEKVIPHFAHQHALNCSLNGGESPYHMQGKLQIYQWLCRQYTDVYLEKYITDIKQRPDILLQIGHRTIAVELQCTVIDPQIIRERNLGYQKLGITPIWLLGANLFRRIGKQKIKVNAFKMEVLQKFSSHISNQLIYYCPETYRFFKATDLYLITNHHAIAHLSYYKNHQITFPQLLLNEHLQKQDLHAAWFQEKKRLRLNYNKTYGKELKWRQWLYEKGTYVQQLPAVVHLPVASQYLMNAPIWHWQSRFLLDFLHPLPIRKKFSLIRVNRFLRPFTNRARASPLIQTDDNAGLDYIQLLVTLGYVKELNPYIFCKVRDILFPAHIEQALQMDRDILQYLSNNDRQLFEMMNKQ